MRFTEEPGNNSNCNPKIPTRRVNEAIDTLKQSPLGTHCLIVYPDLVTLRAIYSHYTKVELEDNNEIVLILPYYETADMVRLSLSGRNIYDDNSNNNTFGYSGVDVGKYEKEGSLMIMDSLKGYFPSEEQRNYRNKVIKVGLEFVSFIDVLLKHAERRRKAGVTVLSDLGSFYHHHRNHDNQKLIKYEKSLPKKYDGMNLKGFCLYHQMDFERQFNLEQQTELLGCHSRNIKLINGR
jgi:hypothetical protein